MRERVLYGPGTAPSEGPGSIASGAAQERPGISVVVPVMNERESLGPLYDRLRNVLDGLCGGYELIFVDDGSTDGSFEALRRLHEADGRVRVIRFSRNFGQTAAFSAGFAEAKADIIVTLDADLQNDPADIPSLLDKMAHGYDLVSGWRVKRRDSLLTRRLPSRAANWLIRQVTGVQLHDYGCSLKAYRSELVKQIRLYGELHRFIPALASRMGARIAEVPVSHYPRIYGRSKYNMSRTFKVIPDVLAVRFLLSHAASTAKPTGIRGLLGELVMRTHYRVRERPAYVVREILQHGPVDKHGTLQSETLTTFSGRARNTQGGDHVATRQSIVAESLQ
ncbi:MAG TPA: glycosyltransferase family 2 protein [Chloroflexia bacterium]